MSTANWTFAKKAALEIERAEGLYLYTPEGFEILDAAGGAIVCNIGHGRRRVAEAMSKAALDASYVVPPFLTPQRAALSEKLSADWLPKTMTRMHFSSGGSESVESAIKIALHYQSAIGEVGRRKIIARDVSYHGTTITTAALSGHPKRKGGLWQALDVHPAAPTPYPLRHPLGPNAASDASYYIDRTRDLIEREGPETIAAFIGEAITGSSGGAIVPPADYWPEIRKLCDEYGIVLICDEVMTGFGRTGTKFGFQHWDFEPDIFLGGKGLAGGYAPLGGVFATEKIGEPIDKAGYTIMFHTFGGHPAACAAATEVLNILDEEDLVANVEKQGLVLCERLNEAFADHPHVAEVRGRGLLQAIEIVKSRDGLERFAPEAKVSERVVAEGLKRGVFYYGGGTGQVRDIVCMGPGFTIGATEIDKMVSTLLDAVNAAIEKVR